MRIVLLNISKYTKKNEDYADLKIAQYSQEYCQGQEVVLIFQSFFFVMASFDLSTKVEPEH